MSNEIMTDEVALIDKQLKIEDDMMGLGISRYRAERLDWHSSDPKPAPESEMRPGIALMKKNLAGLSDRIRNWCETASKGKANANASITSWLNDFDPDVVAFLTIKRCINALSAGDSLNRVSFDIVKMLIDEWEYERFKESNPGYYRVVWTRVKGSTSERYRRGVMANAMNTLGVKRQELTQGERARIGNTLVRLFEDETKLIHIKMVKTRRRQVAVLEPTKAILEWLEDSHSRCEEMSPMLLPMVVKPNDWNGPYGGGYLNPRVGHLKFIKTRNRAYLEELKNSELDEVYNAVNTLQRTPWRINKPVFDVINTLWEQGSTTGKLPEREDVPLPSKGSDFDTNEETRKNYRRKAAPIHEYNSKIKSKRVALAQKLFIAKKFLDEDEIYFPHVLDWRGRIYPVPNLLNPQSDDSAKALLQFANGKPLGESGGFWLAVHIANLFGIDKVSLQERVDWVIENEEKILDSGIDPLGGQMYWVEADKPFQALAACFEWVGFKMYGNDYISNLPIAMDGSCNGLQNFSAMLRDEIGGKATNLVPTDKPQDIYTEVAEAVQRKVSNDIKSGVAVAKYWEGWIDRGLVKRPVMTRPYGSAQFGMRQQILDELSDSKYKNFEGDKWECANYLSKHVFDSIGEVVLAAKEVMDWLQKVARVVCENDLPVRWTTSVGLPVLQAYYKSVSKRIQTHFGGVRYTARFEEETSDLDSRKQAQGISPNFVHSMDASHMMRTVNLCAANDITDLSMVHDSYATHACMTDELNYLLREAFVNQYSEDVLEQFRQELIEPLPEELLKEIPPLPKFGNLDIALISKSDYFFA